jgi:hypothetical protein
MNTTTSPGHKKTRKAERHEEEIETVPKEFTWEFVTLFWLFTMATVVSFTLAQNVLNGGTSSET